MSDLPDRKTSKPSRMSLPTCTLKRPRSSRFLAMQAPCSEHEHEHEHANTRTVRLVPRSVRFSSSATSLPRATACGPRLVRTGAAKSCSRSSACAWTGHGPPGGGRRPSNGAGRGVLEQSRLVAKYLPSGELRRVIQRRSGSPDVVRWMRYDSLGRMVLNAEPNTSTGFSPDPATDPSAIRAWSYAYDDAGDVAGTSEPGAFRTRPRARSRFRSMHLKSTCVVAGISWSQVYLLGCASGAVCGIPAVNTGTTGGRVASERSAKVLNAVEHEHEKRSCQMLYASSRGGVYATYVARDAGNGGPLAVAIVAPFAGITTVHSAELDRYSANLLEHLCGAAMTDQVESCTSSGAGGSWYQFSHYVPRRGYLSRWVWSPRLSSIDRQVADVGHAIMRYAAGPDTLREFEQAHLQQVMAGLAARLGVSAEQMALWRTAGIRE